MEALTLGVIDWLVVATYFAIVIGLGFYLKQFTKNEEDFFLAGRKNSSWVAGPSDADGECTSRALVGPGDDRVRGDIYPAGTEGQITSACRTESA